MKRNLRSAASTRAHSGFSMVEMIGVLAIIAVLAAVIVPRVFSTIAASRVTGTVTSVNTVKAALADFTGKYGTIPQTVVASRIDDLLLTAGYLDSRMNVKVGTQPSSPLVPGAAWTYAAGAWTAAGGTTQVTQSRVMCATSSVLLPSLSAGTNFMLDGATNLPVGSNVISAVLVNVAANDARELSLKIDGDQNTATTALLADDAGKVVYAAPVAGLTTVYIYLAHQ